MGTAPAKLGHMHKARDLAPTPLQLKRRECSNIDIPVGE
jgi:hypothetical protein